MPRNVTIRPELPVDADAIFRIPETAFRSHPYSNLLTDS